MNYDYIASLHNNMVHESQLHERCELMAGGSMGLAYNLKTKKIQFKTKQKQ